MAKMQPVSVACTLPVVLSRQEVSRLIAAAWNLKHQAALAVACGAGLRASEVIAWNVGDADSPRMTLRVQQGKGRNDRCALLPPILPRRLRVWRRVGHARGKILRNGWPFPGLDARDSLSTRQLNRAIHAAADAARIDKRVSMHTLHHSFAARRDLADERVQTNAAGQVVLKPKTAWRDGTTHLVMSPLEFMQRLAALVPRPRLHLIRLVSA
jgi:integrase